MYESGVREESNFLLCLRMPRCPTLSANQLTVSTWASFLTLNCIPLISTSIFTSAPHCSDDCSFAVSLKSGNTSLPTFLFQHRWLFRVPFISICTLGSACYFLKFGRDCIESVNQFGEYYPLKNIKSSYPQQSDVLPFILIFFIAFKNVL